ncbi:conserved hypothetical protein [Tenacibaculum maritimum]|nr:conserved hypothetical protein [Tenacibaculum maritimum]
MFFMKKVIISWDRVFFDGEKKLLPNVNRMFTQIYDVPIKGECWSLKFVFDETPRMQGYKSTARVSFLLDNAPHHLLIKGFKFDFLDKSQTIGSCKIIDTDPISGENIKERIKLIEEEKKELQKYIKSIDKDDFLFTKEDLKKIVSYSDDYPYLFHFILRLDKKVAMEYMEDYFFSIPLENNVVYHSNLELFLLDLKEELGEEKLKLYIESFSNELKEDKIILNALGLIFD